MKNNYLTLDKPCNENWENMKPNASGHYCELCSKTVIDFTDLNPFEIGQKMKMAKGNICARVSQRQLNEPLLDFEPERKLQLPYTNIAAGLMIATAIATGQPLQAENKQTQTELVQTVETVLETNNSNKPKPNHKKPIRLTTFNGIIHYNESQKPVRNAKIIFVTINKLFTAYTQDDGTFSIKIPTELIDNDNVIRVSYKEIKKEAGQKDWDRYETTDSILTKEEINSIYKIKAFQERRYLGGAVLRSKTESNPIVIINGQEIDYKEYRNAQTDKTSSCNLENKDYLYFNSKEAVAIYGAKAIYGLYILNDKIENK